MVQDNLIPPPRPISFLRNPKIADMCLRDKIALEILLKLLDGAATPDSIPTFAYAVADKMLEARMK